jgi:hypothetical protein
MNLTFIKHACFNKHIFFVEKLSQPYFGKSGRMTLTLPKWGLGSLSGLLKLQSSIARVKTPCIELFFYIIRKLSKCRCPKWPRMSHLDIYNTSYDKKKGRESNWQFDSRPLKVGNRPNPSVCKCSVTHHWKAFEKDKNFV